MKEWKRIEPTETKKAGYRTIIEKTFILPDGLRYQVTTINAEDSSAAAVIALTPSNEVIIVRQFRAGPEMIMDELPGGGIDAGETLETGAVRELQEETGYEPGQISYLGECRYDAYTNGHRHYFLATNCVPSKKGQNLAPDEQVEVRLVSVAELFKIAQNGRLTDPGAILLAYDKLKEIEANAKSN
jgi:ADP-ribose pyrophosphatase